MMKRIISCILAFSLLVTLTPQMIAADIQQTNTASVNVSYNEEGLVGLFEPMTIQAEENVLQEVTAEYSYDQHTDETGAVVVDMDLTLRYGTDSITLHPTGEIVHSQRTENLSVWSGPLEAEFEVKGQTYFAMIGFNRFDGVDGVHFTAVITPPEGSGGEDIILDFGDDIATPEAVQETQNAINNAVENRGTNKEDAPFRSARSHAGFDLLDDAMETYRTGDNMSILNDIPAQKFSVYFKPSGQGTASNLKANILAVAVNSYINKYELELARNSMHGHGFVSKLTIKASYNSGNNDARLTRFRSLKSLDNNGKLTNVANSLMIAGCENCLKAINFPSGSLVSLFLNILRDTLSLSRASLAANGSEAELRLSFTEDDQDALMDEIPFMVDWDVEGGNTYEYPFTFKSDLITGFIDSSSYSYFTKAKTVVINVKVPYVFPR